MATLALARAGEPALPRAALLHRSPDVTWRRRAALALGDRGDARACEELGAWWTEVASSTQGGGADGEPLRLAIELRPARELLEAAAAARCKGAVPSIVRALDDLRLRPYAADALAVLGDDRARAPLLRMLAAEPYVTTRPHEARALLALGVHDWVAPASASASPAPVPTLETTLAGPPGPVRVAVLLSDGTAHLEVTGAIAADTAGADEGEVRLLDLATGAAGQGGRPRLQARASTGGIVAVWRLPLPPT
jgi:hypothetical protein